MEVPLHKIMHVVAFPKSRAVCYPTYLMLTDLLNLSNIGVHIASLREASRLGLKAGSLEIGGVL